MGPAKPVALGALAAAGAGARAAPPPAGAPAAERAGRERPRTAEQNRGTPRRWGNDSGLGVLRRVVPVQGRHLLAGAVAGAASRSALAPLERVKLELQLHQRPGGAAGVLRGIVRREGVRGLWRGNLLNLLRTVPFRTLNYFTYDTVHKALQRARGREGQPLSSAEQSLAGGMAGFTAVVACYPLDVVRTLMLTQPALFRRGPVAALREVAAAGGVAGLYRGILPAFLSVVPSNAVFYVTYECLSYNHIYTLRKAERARDAGAGEGDGRATRARAGARIKDRTVPPEGTSVGRRRRLGGEERAAAGRSGTEPEGGARADAGREEKVLALPPQYILLYGGLAGVLAELVVYPLETVRRQLQMQTARYGGAGRGSAWLRARHARLVGGSSAAARAGRAAARARRMALFLVRNGGGPRRLYLGAAPSALQILPSAALSFFLFQQMKLLLGVPP